MPRSSAIRFTSSNSIWVFTSFPDLSYPFFTLTGPNEVGRTSSDRARIVLNSGLSRKPKVDVSRKTASLIAEMRDDGERIERRIPGRPFFICTGKQSTSSAPSRRILSAAAPIYSLSISSMSASMTHISSSKSGASISPMKTRSAFGLAVS